MTVLAVTGLESGYDSADGGFGRAPKFPPSMALEFLLRHYQRTGPDSESGQAALRMAAGTCAAMASGGMYDQLGGGFARYSVDGTWTVPHFEKMLYDNALLVGVYAHWWRLTGNELARRVAEETCDFMIRELRTPEGGFASSLDADSDDGSGHAEEGAYYVWTPAQLREVLGPDDGEFAIAAFGVTEPGTFEHGTSVLQRRHSVPDAERLDWIRGTLLVSQGRPQPAGPGRQGRRRLERDGDRRARRGRDTLRPPRPGVRRVPGRPPPRHRPPRRSLRPAARLVRTSRDGVAGPARGNWRTTPASPLAC